MKLSACALVLFFACLFVIPAEANWSVPVPITEINTSQMESGASLSADGLTIYFDRTISNGYFQLYQATRTSLGSPFGTATPISELNVSNKHVAYPWTSADGLRMYYSQRINLMLTTRPTTSSPWSSGTPISELNPVFTDTPRLSADELSIVFQSSEMPGYNDGKYHMYTATRNSTDQQFGTIRALSELNITGASDVGGSLSADGLTIYFASNRSGLFRIYQATRTNYDSPFGSLQMLNMPAGYSCPTISLDGKTMLLTDLNWNIYESQYIPEPATLALLALGLPFMRKKNA